MSLTDSEREVVVGVLVDVGEAVPQRQHKLRQHAQVAARRVRVLRDAVLGLQAHRRHERRADGFDLVDALEALVVQKLLRDKNKVLICEK